jgi:hypothetical protein
VTAHLLAAVVAVVAVVVVAKSHAVLDVAIHIQIVVALACVAQKKRTVVVQGEA